MKSNFKKHLAAFLVLMLLLTSLPFMAIASSKAEKPDVPPVPAGELRGSKSSTTEKTDDTKPSEPKGSKIDVFKFTEANVSALYKAYSGKFMVSPIYKEHDNFAKLIQTLGTLKDNPNVKSVELDSEEIAENIEGSFLIVLRDGTRRIYTLNKNNLLQAGEKGFYQIPSEQYNALLSIFNTEYKNSNFAQWLIFMVPKNVTRVSFEDSSNGDVINLDKEYLSAMVQLIRGMPVSGGTHYSPLKDDFEPGNGKSRIMLYFDNSDSYYTIWLDGNTAYIESDGLRIGTQYTITTGYHTLLAKAFKNPGATFNAEPDTPAA